MERNVALPRHVACGGVAIWGVCVGVRCTACAITPSIPNTQTHIRVGLCNDDTQDARLSSTLRMAQS